MSFTQKSLDVLKNMTEQSNRVALYCPIVECRRFHNVCEHFITLRSNKEQLPEGNFKCSRAINRKKCPVYLEINPQKPKRKRKRK